GRHRQLVAGEADGGDRAERPQQPGQRHVQQVEREAAGRADGEGDAPQGRRPQARATPHQPLPMLLGVRIIPGPDHRERQILRTVRCPPPKPPPIPSNRRPGRRLPSTIPPPGWPPTSPPTATGSSAWTTTRSTSSTAPWRRS